MAGFFVTLQLALALPVAAFASQTPAPDFRFASVYSDGMVLQSAPKQAVVWGICPEGAAVTVELAGNKLAATTQLYGGNWTWAVALPASPISFAGAAISATSTKATGNKTIALAGVLFGVRHDHDCTSAAGSCRMVARRTCPVVCDTSGASSSFFSLPPTHTQ